MNNTLLDELNDDLLLILAKELKSEFKKIANIGDERIKRLYNKYVKDIKRGFILLEDAFVPCVNIDINEKYRIEYVNEDDLSIKMKIVSYFVRDFGILINARYAMPNSKLLINGEKTESVQDAYNIIRDKVDIVYYYRKYYEGSYMIFYTTKGASCKYVFISMCLDYRIYYSNNW